MASEESKSKKNPDEIDSGPDEIRRETVDVDSEIDYDIRDLEMEKKQKEINELSDRYKRLAAEYDNFRKRTLKEKQEIYENSVMDIIGKFLPVLDNLDRAINNLSKIENKDVREGVEMVLNQIKSTFDELGIVEIDCCDEFDPKCHEAIMHINDDSYGENTIAEVFQKGYRIGEKIIRCAVVKVAN